MQRAAHRKLIDLEPGVFQALSLESQKRNISLKRLIENILADACPVERRKVSPGIMRLVGSALPKDGKVSEIQDDRLQYLLSK